MGYTELPSSIPEGFIGPPLQQGFSTLFGMNSKQTAQAVSFFREYYGEYGLYENEPFDGINELLEILSDYGCALFVATSKLEGFAWKIIRHFEFDRYIRDIAGADYEGTHSKQDLIEQLIQKYRLNKDDTCMIGDTAFDIIGARGTGIPCIGVTYGFGLRNELEVLNPLIVVDTPVAISEFLTGIQD
jgi:phosphoglycolate phosphatase